MGNEQIIGQFLYKDLVEYAENLVEIGRAYCYLVLYLSKEFFHIKLTRET